MIDQEPYSTSDVAERLGMTRVTALKRTASESIESPMMLWEVAKRLGVSRKTANTLFEGEPGVLIIESPEKMHKRVYRTIRVPHHVFDRVYRKLEVKR